MRGDDRQEVGAVAPSRLRLWVHLVGAVGALGVQAMLWSAERGFAPRRLVGDEVGYLARALAVWSGQPLPADFIWPPLQVWFLAPLVGLTGGEIWLAQLVQTALLVLAAWLLRRLWLRLDPRPLAADLAFWLLLASPAFMAFGFYLWPEPVHLVLLLGALWLLAAQRRPLASAAAAGGAVGLAMLAKSLLAAFWPVLFLAFWSGSRGRFDWRRAAAFAAILLVVTGPFLWRGWAATGKPLIADSSVFNLAVGLQDDWRSDYVHDAHVGAAMSRYVGAGQTPQERNAAFAGEIRDTIAARGGLLAVARERMEVQYFRLFNAKRTLLSQLPGPACAGYLGAYTLPTHWVAGIQFLTRAQYLGVLLLAAFGLFLRRWRGVMFWLVMAFLAYQLALFFALHVKARFLMPMWPFISGFAGSGLAGVLAGRAGTPPGRLPLRWLAALATAALLLFLACGGPVLDLSCAGAT